MDIIVVLIIMAVVFGLCWVVDKLFAKLFRSQAQHNSGLSVRLTKRYGSAGLILLVLGLGSAFSGISNSEWLLIVGGALIALVGVGLVVYYMTTGIFYDSESFIHTAFGKKKRTYRYGQIRCQQRYVVQGGSNIIELYMDDGSAVQVLTTMSGYKAFLNAAFLGWVQQNNVDMRAAEDFHNPDEGCWFPDKEAL